MTRISSVIFPTAVVQKLCNEAKKYADVAAEKDKQEWYFGELIVNMYECAHEDIKAELSFEAYCREAERVMNQALPFPMFPESGSKLRRWANMWEFWKDKDYKAYKLSYDHFFRAKRLNFNGKATWQEALDWAKGNNPDKERKSAEDMEYHFDPPVLTNPREIAEKWLSSAPDTKGWRKADKMRFGELVDEAKELIERNL